MEDGQSGARVRCRFYENEFPKVDEVVMAEVCGSSVHGERSGFLPSRFSIRGA